MRPIDRHPYGFDSQRRLIMGTCSGDFDHGVLTCLMCEVKFDADRLEVLVDHRSGLLGSSGLGSDLRQ